MKPYRVTPLAARHLKDIARYTLKTWGKDRRDRYLFDIRSRIEWLCAHPGYGTPRPEIADDVISFPQGEHIVFCRILTDRLDVIGVVHKRMEYKANLDG